MSGSLYGTGCFGILDPLPRQMLSVTDEVAFGIPAIPAKALHQAASRGGQDPFGEVMNGITLDLPHVHGIFRIVGISNPQVTVNDLDLENTVTRIAFIAGRPRVARIAFISLFTGSAGFTRDTLLTGIPFIPLFTLGSGLARLARFTGFPLFALLAGYTGFPGFPGLTRLTLHR